MTKPSRKPLTVGDVVFVVIRFSDGAEGKRRPALVVSEVDRYGDHLMLPITSNPQAADALPLTAADMSEGRLPSDSWIKPLKPNPVAAALVERVVGKVKPQVLAKVCSVLCPALGCA